MSEMTEERAREILEPRMAADGWIVPGETPLALRLLCRNIQYTADELEAIVFWMRKNA